MSFSVDMPSDGRRGCCSVLTWPNMAGEDIVQC